MQTSVVDFMLPRSWVLTIIVRVTTPSHQRVLSLSDFAPLLLITKNGGENWNVRVGNFSQVGLGDLAGRKPWLRCVNLYTHQG
jgi:hypothetical protein